MTWDADRAVTVGDDPVYWAAYETSSLSQSALTIDQAEATRWARDLAAERRKPMRVLRDAGIVAVVGTALPDGQVFDATGKPVTVG